MELEHPVIGFLSDDDINTLCDTKSFKRFYKNIYKLQPHNKNYDIDKFRGDIFELFVEFLLKCRGIDSHINSKYIVSWITKRKNI